MRATHGTILLNRIISLNHMKNNLQKGFVPFIVIAVVAVLAVGGGVYYATQGGDSGTEAEVENNVEVENQNNTGTEGEGRATLRSLLAIGRDTKCTFTSSEGEYESSGTVFITANGEMRGDFNSSTPSGNVASHMLVKADGNAYVWSGNQGSKMDFSAMNTSSNAQGQSEVGIDTQVNYDCDGWTRDDSRFVVPTNINFIDIGAMMKAGLPGGVDIQAAMQGKLQ